MEKFNRTSSHQIKQVSQALYDLPQLTFPIFVFYYPLWTHTHTPPPTVF